MTRRVETLALLGVLLIEAIAVQGEASGDPAAGGQAMSQDHG